MKDRRGRRDSRRGGERRRGDMDGMKVRRGRGDGGRGGRSIMERSDRLRCLRTREECRRPKKFWSYYNNHSSQETKKQT